MSVKGVADALRAMAQDPRVDRYVQKARLEAAGLIEADPEFKAIEKLQPRLEAVAQEIERLGRKGKRFGTPSEVDSEHAKLAAMVRAILPAEAPR